MYNNLVSISEAAKMLGVSIDTLRRWDNSGKFKSVRVDENSNRYFRKSDIVLFINDQDPAVKKWVTSQVGYEPEINNFCKTRDVFQARLEHWQSDLTREINPNLASLISAIVGEIGNNSFDHNLGNWPDILGIYFTYSLNKKRVILADRGLGILTTLKRVKPELNSHSEALKIAFTKILSGRAPENRGNGLKFVRNVIIKNPIKLNFQTGDSVINLSMNNNNIETQIVSEPIRGCLAVIEY